VGQSLSLEQSVYCDWHRISCMQPAELHSVPLAAHVKPAGPHDALASQGSW
jgi:hypothetical protein